MSSNDIIGLAKDFSGLISKGLQQDKFPRDDKGVGKMIDRVYYLTFDRETLKAYMIIDLKINNKFLISN